MSQEKQGKEEKIQTQQKNTAQLQKEQHQPQKQGKNKHQKKNNSQGKKKNPPQVKKGDNIILVGKKPTMSYVMAVMTQFKAKQKSIQLRARGKAISKAVDVVEIVRNRFLKNLHYQAKFETEQLENKEKKNVNVSVITVLLTQTKPSYQKQ